jgi:prepilin-type N-terminal cleavage/methylation domain-containing protein
VQDFALRDSRNSVSPSSWENSGRAGYTLLEIIVVLILLAVATAVVAPGILSPRPEPSSALRALIRNAAEASVRRGETVRLRIDRSGTWEAVAGTPPESEILMSGKLADPPVSATDLIFSPLGTCAPAIESDPAETHGLNPLTCEPRS